MLKCVLMLLPNNHELLLVAIIVLKRINIDFTLRSNAKERKRVLDLSEFSKSVDSLNLMENSLARKIANVDIEL